MQNSLDGLTTTVHDAFMQPRITSETVATQRLYDSVKASKLNEGGPWLEETDLFEALEMCRDPSFSRVYVQMTHIKEDEEISCKWVRRHLENARAARTSAPGGSGAP